MQARPITALPEPAADAPTDWSVPDPKAAYYVRASIVEQLPDPLSPLFADLVDSSVTRSLQALFREFVGQDVGARRRHRAAHRQRVRLLPVLPRGRSDGSCCAARPPSGS